MEGVVVMSEVVVIDTWEQMMERVVEMMVEAVVRMEMEATGEPRWRRR